MSQAQQAAETAAKFAKDVAAGSLGPNKFPALTNDLLLRTARGEKTERTPVWVHRQAGRYLPEYKATRATLSGFFELCRTPAKACEVTLQPILRYSTLDAAIIFSDILVIPQALGLEVHMVPGKGPQLPEPLLDRSHLPRMNRKWDIKQSLGYVLEAITVTRHALQGRVPLIGFSGAPWTLMCYMVEGGGAKSYNKAKAWLYKDPEAAHDLLQLLTDVIVEYLLQQVAAGAQMLEVFDSWSGDLSPAAFDKFCLPYLTQIAEKVKTGLSERGLDDVPMTVFAKGAHYAIEDLATKTRYDVLSLDWQMDPATARARVDAALRDAGLEGKKKVTLQGNLEPSVLLGDADTIRAETAKMIAGFGAQGHIANLGHGMLPYHNPEHLGVYLQAVKDESLKVRGE